MEIFLLPFFLHYAKYALDASIVDSVVSAVEITALPEAPEIVLGIINLRGTIVPVLDIRKRFRTQSRPPDIHDVFIIANTSNRKTALLVDLVEPVFKLTHEVIPASGAVPGIRYVKGIVKLPEGLLFIHDLDTFLSLEEDTELSKSLQKFDSKQESQRE